MAIPVLEGRAAAYANFPKSHPLHLGTNIAPLLKEADLVLLVESRVPWYPPSNAPTNARIVAISEHPLKDHMVYQTMEADTYLEGDAGVDNEEGPTSTSSTSATRRSRRSSPSTTWTRSSPRSCRRLRPTSSRSSTTTSSSSRSAAGRSCSCRTGTAAT